MVSIYQTSEISTGVRTRSSKRENRLFSQNIYNVTVNGEDGEYFTCEVMADSSASACALAEELARDVIADITFIEVHVFK